MCGDGDACMGMRNEYMNLCGDVNEYMNVCGDGNECVGMRNEYMNVCGDGNEEWRHDCM